MDTLQSPAWARELLEAVQKQSRAAAKQAARLEGGLGEIEAKLSALAKLGPKPAAAASGPPLDDLFDALDGLDEARSLAAEPHLAEGLAKVARRIERFCESAGYARRASTGQPPDARFERVVGSEPRADLERGRISRVVRAAVLSGSTLVREGEVIVSGGAAQELDRRDQDGQHMGD